MAGPVFVHIGLAKTGTTTLQQDVFSKTPAIAYLGKNLVPESVDAARRSLTRGPAERFDAAATRAAFEAFRAAAPGVAVFSDEDLSVWKFLDPAEMGRRVGAVFPDNRLVYVTRRPRDWVVSQYFFRLSTWRPDTMAGINPWLEAHLERLEVGSDVAEIRFTETFRRFRAGAGQGAFLVLPYEMMAVDLGSFLGAVESFIGLDGELRALAPAAAKAPKKARIGTAMANFHRLPGLAERNRERFLGVARAVAARALPEDRPAFEALAGDGAATAEQWREWLARVERRVRRALAAGDVGLGEALDLFDDYEVRPDLLEQIEAVGRAETEAMRADFGVDLRAWGY